MVVWLFVCFLRFNVTFDAIFQLYSEDQTQYFDLLPGTHDIGN